MNQPATILVVDDIAANRDTLRELLDAIDCRIIEAPDGPTALQLAAGTPPDLVLLDVMMPGMDGMEVCRRLRANARLAEVPVIMVTALDDQASLLAGLEAGADDFITKPFNRTELRARVRSITRLNRYRRIMETQAALQDSEKHFHALFELGPVAVYSCDAEGTIQDFNRRALALWGREPAPGAPADRFCGSFKMYRPDGTLLDREQSPMARVCRGASPAVEDEEFVIERQDGTRVTVLINVVPLRNDQGEITCAINCFHDISTRKRLETELRQSEERHRKMLVDSPDAHMVHVDGLITFANRAFCKLLRASDPARFLGRPALEVVHPDNREFILEARRKLLSGLSVPPYETRYLRLDGTTVDVEAAVVAVDFRGRKEIQVIARDITARKAAELALRESEQWLRATFEQAAVGVAQTDVTTGRFVRVNQRFCEIVGYSREEVERLTFADITHQQDLDLNVENVARLRAGSIREFAQEKRYVRKDRTTVWTSIAVSSIGPAGQPPISFIAFVQDISERKQAQEHSLRAQRLDNLGMLAAGIAHDFNNALAPIILASPLLRQHWSADAAVRRVSDQAGADFRGMRADEISPGAQRLLDIVEKSAERGASLVRQLLSFARGASGERHLLQAHHLLKELGDLVAATFAKSISFRLELPRDLWPIQANATQIHQVFLNLCVNARDAMAQGGQLTLTAANRTLTAAAAAEIPEARPGNYLVVEVQDTGEGIPPELLPRIWEHFFTTKGEADGTGLGLSTVRGIVQQHEGFVTVQSQVGRGTRFTVYLPADREARAAHAGPEHVPPARGRDELILVVDDDENVRLLAAEILNGYGYQAIVAGDGADAIAVFAPRAAEVRLLLTDLQMPILGGLALAAVLHRIRPDLAVVAMSGAENRDSATPHHDRAIGFVAKPFQRETLLSLVRDTLDAHPPAAPAPSLPSADPLTVPVPPL